MKMTAVATRVIFTFFTYNYRRVHFQKADLLYDLRDIIIHQAVPAPKFPKYRNFRNFPNLLELFLN